MGPIQLCYSRSLRPTPDSLQVSSVLGGSISRAHHGTYILLPELKPLMMSHPDNKILVLKTEAQRRQVTEVVSGGNKIYTLVC